MTRPTWDDLKIERDGKLHPLTDGIEKVFHELAERRAELEDAEQVLEDAKRWRDKLRREVADLERRCTPRREQ